MLVCEDVLHLAGDEPLEIALLPGLKLVKDALTALLAVLSSGVPSFSSKCLFLYRKNVAGGRHTSQDSCVLQLVRLNSYDM